MKKIQTALVTNLFVLASCGTGDMPVPDTAGGSGDFQTGTGCAAYVDDAGNAYLQGLLDGAPAFANPPVVDFTTDPNNEAEMELRYRQYQIAGCNAELRGWFGDWSLQDESNLGYARPAYPTMHIRPGQTYRSLIVNNLPSNVIDLPNKTESLRSSHDHEPDHETFGGHGGASTILGYLPPDAEQPEPNIPHDFNVTNLHTHGWHVSPTGNSDNVLIAIPPRSNEAGDEFDHVYHQVVYLPEDHIAGTFWYHPHKHGSTTIQVGSGMAGTLQVVDESKGLDAIPQIRRARDHTFVLQQIGYGVDGLIEDYSNLQEQPFGALNRPTMVNGQVYPKLQVALDEVQRWRFVHAGITAGIAPTLVKKDFACTTTPIARQTPYQSALPQHEIAFDGIPTGNDVSVDIATLFPGYRVDVLVKFDSSQVQAGDELLLVDANRACMNTTTNKPNWRSARYVLAQIEVVAGTAPVTELPSADALYKAREDYAYEGGPIEPLVTADLNAPDNFVHFAAETLARGATVLTYHCPMDGGACEPCDSNGMTPSGQMCATQAAYTAATDKTDYWYIDTQGTKVAAGNYMVCDLFALGPNAGQWGACQTFNAGNEYVRTLKLDTASAWFVSSKGPNATHIFHIHVNPFQVQRKFVDGSTGLTGEELVWKDTLLAPDVTRPANADAAQLEALKSQTAYMLSRYTEFTGAFVQHCHVLNHEDQGMMQVVEVEPAAYSGP